MVVNPEIQRGIAASLEKTGFFCHLFVHQKSYLGKIMLLAPVSDAALQPNRFAHRKLRAANSVRATAKQTNTYLLVQENGKLMKLAVS